MKPASDLISNQPKVLFVDDEADFLSSIRRALRKEPYTVVTAQSGENALQKMERTKIDLVVSDYKMPEMDGLTLIKKIRSIYTPVEVMMITAVADINIAIEALNSLCISKFFLKPIDIDRLKPSLREIVQETDKVIVNSAHEHGNRYRETGETKIESIYPEPESWWLHYDGPVFECPHCKQGVGFLVDREPWMKLVPMLRRFQCNYCQRKFYKLYRE